MKHRGEEERRLMRNKWDLEADLMEDESMARIETERGQGDEE